MAQTERLLNELSTCVFNLHLAQVTNTLLFYDTLWKNNLIELVKDPIGSYKALKKRNLQMISQ
jgi:hypothetical protein